MEQADAPSSPNCAACVVCKSSNDQIELSKLGEKGCKGLIEASEKRTWIGRDISPTDWGWTMNGDKLVPVKTSLPAAPERLLKMIRCCCRQNCDSKRCTCRKHGLCCTAACGECHGLSCSNKGELFDETEQD